MSRTYTFEEFVNMPREEAAAIIEAENVEFKAALRRATDGMEVAPTEYSEWLTGPTTEECSAPVETTEPEVD